MEQKNQTINQLSINQLHSVLVLADDVVLTRTLFLGLHSAGFDCHYAPDGMTGIETVVNKSPHLIMLDASLPDFDSHLMCIAIRRLSRAPILMMSDAKDSMLLPAIEAGADGCLLKPCQPAVWMARVEAQLRRVYSYDSGDTRQNTTSLPALDEIMKRITHQRPPRPKKVGTKADQPCLSCGQRARPITVSREAFGESLCHLCAPPSPLAALAG